MVRLASEQDIEFLYGLYMHPDINPWLLYESMTMEAFTPVIQDLISREAIYIFEDSGVAVGMFKLIPQKFRNSHIIYLGGLALDPTQRGKGYGEVMLEAAIARCGEQGARRIELTVATGNHRAIALYERMGFYSEGILRNYTYLKSEDRYIDEQVMALLL